METKHLPERGSYIYTISRLLSLELIKRNQRISKESHGLKVLWAQVSTTGPEKIGHIVRRPPSYQHSQLELRQAGRRSSVVGRRLKR